MDKIAYRNKFRIIDPNGNILRLNSVLNKNLVQQSIEGFTTQDEAEAQVRLYCMAANLSEKDFKIEPYSEGFYLNVPISQDDNVNKEIARRKLFSGKGIKFNTHIPRKHEEKYSPDKFYTREIWMEQSTERNKGRSTLKKFKHKKNQGIVDTETYEKMGRLKSHNDTIGGDLWDKFISNLKAKGFANRKELRLYLQGKGFSKRKIDTIYQQLYFGFTKQPKTMAIQAQLSMKAL